MRAMTHVPHACTYSAFLMYLFLWCLEKKMNEEQRKYINRLKDFWTYLSTIWFCFSYNWLKILIPLRFCQTFSFFFVLKVSGWNGHVQLEAGVRWERKRQRERERQKREMLWEWTIVSETVNRTSSCSGFYYFTAHVFVKEKNEKCNSVCSFYQRVQINKTGSTDLQRWWSERLLIARRQRWAQKTCIWPHIHEFFN